MTSVNNLYFPFNEEEMRKRATADRQREQREAQQTEDEAHLTKLQAIAAYDADAAQEESAAQIASMRAQIAKMDEANKEYADKLRELNTLEEELKAKQKQRKEQLVPGPTIVPVPAPTISASDVLKKVVQTAPHLIEIGRAGKQALDLREKRKAPLGKAKKFLEENARAVNVGAHLANRVVPGAGVAIKAAQAVFEAATPDVPTEEDVRDADQKFLEELAKGAASALNNKT